MERFFLKRDFVPLSAPSWAGVWPQTVNHMHVEGRSALWAVSTYCFQLVLSEGVRLKSEDTTDTILPKDSVFIIKPNTRFSYYAEDGGSMHVYALRITGPLTPYFFNELGFNQERDWFQPLDPQGIYWLLEELLALASDSRATAQYRAVSALHRLPLLTSKGKEIVQSDLVDKVLDYLQNHLEAGENVEQLAVRFGVSRYTLFEKVKEKFGVSPVKLLISKRIARAKHLLESTTYPMTDVAHFSGYQSVEHFQRQFCERVGEPPRLWRLRMEEKLKNSCDIEYFTDPHS